ncbi:hypothetical protein F9C11_17585 [Amycolatopsis sp. VS8301801F10]|uniref:hypothetical protein n=1 Tax=Amycolatopsis sp. VS8301801F10 TaxID=2652442 RepID=UPI0038FD0734
MNSRTVLVGLGSAGRAIASSLPQRAEVEVVGAADADPRLAGQDLGILTGRAANGISVVSDPADLPSADLAVVATASELNKVADTLVPLLERSFNVLSICEELACPWRSHPGLARMLDDAAKAHGVTVVGGGANPGVLTALTQRVKSVRIRRRANMSRYGAILSKFCLGLTEQEFEAARGEGVDHYGFEQAVASLADGLGWDLDSVDVGEVSPAVVAGSPRAGDRRRIEPGQISAVAHAARGVLGGETVIDLEITFSFFAAGDEVSAGDDYRIVGEERVIDLRSSADSFPSTVAAAVNAAVVGAERGLLSMGDLRPRAVAAKGERREARIAL